MKKTRPGSSIARRCLVGAVLVGLALTGATLADLMVTNAAGVRAGITGIIYRPADNSVGINFAVIDPSGTNVTTFLIQRSSDVTNWSNYSSSVTMTGSVAGQISDFATPTKQFYRMRLINF